MSESKILLESRYEDVVTLLTLIDDTRGIITTTGNYIRHILDDDGKTLKAVDFEGGPMLAVGSPLTNTKKRIKSIKSCYYVELE